MVLSESDPAVLAPGNNKVAPTYPDIIPSINKSFNLQSFADIKQQGTTATERGKADEEIRFDMQGSDSVATEYRRVKETLQGAMANDGVLKQLSFPDDQAQYEHRLATLVTDATKGTMFDAKNYRQSTTDKTTRNLNGLEPDGEYDCEHLSYIRGMLMHEGDQHAVQLGLKNEPTKFYLMSGSMVNISGADETLGGHAYIASADTGNIIEATARDHGYRPTNRTFDQLVAGYPATTETYLYTPSMFNVDEPTIRQRHAVILSNPHDTEKLTGLQIDKKNDASQHTPELMAAVEKAIAKKIPGIEAHCSKPITIGTEYSGPLMTEAGPLTTDPHVDRECRKIQIVVNGDNIIATELAKELAKKAIVESLGEKRFEFFSVPDAEKSENRHAPTVPHQPDAPAKQTER